jgi:hypothetical protein
MAEMSPHIRYGLHIEGIYIPEEIQGIVSAGESTRVEKRGVCLMRQLRAPA